MNKANDQDDRSPFLDLNLQITDGIVHTKIFDKRDDFNFEIANYPHLDGDVPRATSYGIYISQLIRFARACSEVDDFNHRNITITGRLISQGYRYHKLRKTFSKFFHRNSTLVEKYKCSLRKLIILGISHPDFYGDITYKIRKIRTSQNFYLLFPRLLKKYISRGYNQSILFRTAGLVLDHDVVDHFKSLLGCTVTI